MNRIIHDILMLAAICFLILIATFATYRMATNKYDEKISVMLNNCMDKDKSIYWCNNLLIKK